MSRHTTIPTEERHNIRRIVSEHRGVHILEVPYPSANATYYQYSLELELISPEDYEIVSEIESIRHRNYQRTRDQARITRETRNFLNRRNLSRNRMLRILEEGYNTIMQDISTDYTLLINRGFRLMTDRIDEAVGIVRGHPMEGIEVTHERIMERHGERLADTNNSLCRECLIPIELGEDLCEDCHAEIEIIPRWIMS